MLASVSLASVSGTATTNDEEILSCSDGPVAWCLEHQSHPGQSYPRYLIDCYLHFVVSDYVQASQSYTGRVVRKDLLLP